jgi:hypothetical protein
MSGFQVRWQKIAAGALVISQQDHSQPLRGKVVSANAAADAGGETGNQPTRSVTERKRRCIRQPKSQAYIR